VVEDEERVRGVKDWRREAMRMSVCWRTELAEAMTGDLHRGREEKAEPWSRGDVRGGKGLRDQVTNAFDFVEFCFEKKLAVALVVGVILKRERERINREQGGRRRDERRENQYRGRHKQCQPSCGGGGDET